MIAFVEDGPMLDLHGEHFLAVFVSGGEPISLMLTTKAFYLLKHQCAKAAAERQIAEMEAREKIVPFPNAKTPPKRRKKR